MTSVHVHSYVLLPARLFLQPTKSKKANVRKKESMPSPLKSFIAQWSSGKTKLIVVERELNSNEVPSNFSAEALIFPRATENQKVQEQKRKEKEISNKHRTKKGGTSIHRGGEATLDSKDSDSAAADTSENGTRESENYSSDVKLKPSHHENDNADSVCFTPFQTGPPPENASLSTSVPHHPIRPPNDAPEPLNVLKRSVTAELVASPQAGLPVPKSGLTRKVTSNPLCYVELAERLPPSFTGSSEVDTHIAYSLAVIQGSRTPPHLLRPPEQSSTSPGAPEKTDSRGKLNENKCTNTSNKKDDDERQRFYTPTQVADPYLVNTQSVRTKLIIIFCIFWRYRDNF